MHFLRAYSTRTIGLISVALVLGASACSSSSSSGVATVNIERITSHWDKFSDYERQLRDASQRVSSQSLSDDERTRQLSALHDKYTVLQSEITTDVRHAAIKVAQDQGYHLIVTREFVGYGGRDVTEDVEKALGVVETPTPGPGASAAAATASPSPLATVSPAATVSPTPTSAAPAATKRP